MKGMMLAICFGTLILCVLFSGCASLQQKDISTYRTARMLEPGTPLCRAYRQAEKSIQDCEKFISQYPDERDLCAGARLRIAELYARQGQREEAIKAYQKAIDEYGEEIVPDVSARFRVKDWALFHMGLCYKDMGQGGKAMEIFSNLTKEAWDTNTKRAARTRYLETKQSHLKIKVTVSVADKKTYAVGEEIPVLLVIENNTEETVVFKCYSRIASMLRGSIHALAPREGSEELTLLPGARCEEALIFTHTKGLIPGEYKVTGLLTGIRFATNCVMVQMVSGE